MRSRLRVIGVLAALVVAGLTGWVAVTLSRPPHFVAGRAPSTGVNPGSAPASPGSPARVSSVEPTTAEETPGETPAPPEPSAPPELSRAPAPAPMRVAAAEAVPGPEPALGLTPTVVLENVRSVFRNYQARFGGNPVGTNPEITQALNGGNPGQTIFLNPEDGTRVNERGEMVDNWGTPFFFHQLSAKQMEIRSAGADRRMWTADDLVIR